MFQFALNDIIDTAQYLPTATATALLVCITISIHNRLTGRKNASYLPVFLLSAYLVVLLYLVFLNREPGSREGIDLELFGTVGHGLRGDSYVLENIFVFIPFGFLFPFVWKRTQSFRWCIPLGCLCSISIEAIQYITKRGYCQLDDVVTNTVGTLLGWGLWKLISVIMKQK